jgi:hypothetical protein
MKVGTKNVEKKNVALTNQGSHYFVFVPPHLAQLISDVPNWLENRHYSSARH